MKTEQTDSFKYFFKEFTHIRYTRFKHKFPRMSEQVIMQKIIREWEGQTKKEREQIYELYKQSGILNKQIDQSQSFHHKQQKKAEVKPVLPEKPQQQSSAKKSKQKRTSSREQRYMMRMNKKSHQEIVPHDNTPKTSQEKKPVQVQQANILEKEQHSQKKPNKGKQISELPSQPSIKEEVFKKHLDHVMENINKKQPDQLHPLKDLFFPEDDLVSNSQSDSDQSQSLDKQDKENNENNANSSKQVKLQNEPSQFRKRFFMGKKSKSNRSTNRFGDSKFHVYSRNKSIEKNKQLSIYLQFFKKSFKIMKNENPEMGPIEITKIISSIWQHEKCQKEREQESLKQKDAMKKFRLSCGRRKFSRTKRQQGYSGDEVKKQWKHLPKQSRLLWAERENNLVVNQFYKKQEEKKPEKDKTTVKRYTLRFSHPVIPVAQVKVDEPV